MRDFSRGLGVVEIATALLIAAGPVWPKLSIVGSLTGIGMFLTTLSFVITTPGVWQAGYGFPALAGFPGQFLVKDVVLLGGYLEAEVDFIADNPELTLFDCHQPTAPGLRLHDALRLCIGAEQSYSSDRKIHPSKRPTEVPLDETGVEFDEDKID